DGCQSPPQRFAAAQRWLAASRRSAATVSRRLSASLANLHEHHFTCGKQPTKLIAALAHFENGKVVAFSAQEPELGQRLLADQVASVQLHGLPLVSGELDALGDAIVWSKRNQHFHGILLAPLF